MRFLLWPACAAGFAFLMTALGAALVFFFRSRISARAERLCMGFAGGVMSAAAVFSLLVPAAAQLRAAGRNPFCSVTLGFLLGAAFVPAMERVMGRVHAGAFEDASMRRKMLLFSAVTLHNIPEGMAVGLAFAGAGMQSAAAYAGAWALAFGVGVQNFPEGAAVALPLRQSGMSRKRSFLFGAASGAVEPIAAVLSVLLCACVRALMPGLMAFAAGAMMIVVFEQMLPSACRKRDGVLAVTLGYAVMMALDIALG